ncbi:MAG: hypothetical protein CVT49_12135 [candidate division Zixibacteria bacterium HGW-Zixibacteria-1]|nr:MAG: hypothetical protein CVT49_12135 [candidate division Zixibacteria bacterium HGW-Zixibacteria-1]
MAEKKDSGAKPDKAFDPDNRFRYIGFEVHPGKIKDLFKSEAEKEALVKEVRAKRESGMLGREKTTFDIPRIASYEKIVLTITSLVLIVSLFLPWFSGYREFVVESIDTTVVGEQAMLPDSLGMQMTDSSALAAGMIGSAEATGTQVAGRVADATASQPVKDDKGFASVSSQRKRQELRREYEKASAVGSLLLMGDVLSSGIILKITGILFLLYMIFSLGGGLYNLYALYGLKGDMDTKALKLKKVMAYAWVPVGIWFFCLILSFFGASYSFDSTETIKQIGTSYGPGTYLSILGYGFYISLACFIMNAVKAAEI